VQTLLMTHLPHDPALFNEFHALLVRVGKEHCGPRPRCAACPLRFDLGGRPPVDRPRGPSSRSRSGTPSRPLGRRRPPSAARRRRLAGG
jgi:hypothetical protein